MKRMNREPAVIIGVAVGVVVALLTLTGLAFDWPAKVVASASGAVTSIGGAVTRLFVSPAERKKK